MEKSWLEKEYLVLKAIYDACRANNYAGIDPFALQRKVGLDETELNMIINGIDKKEWLSKRSTGTYIIDHKGMEYLDRYENPRQNSAGNNFTFNAPVGAFQHQTQNSSQNVNQEVEKNMQKSYADVERMVLEKIFELCQKSPTGHILYYDFPKNIDTAPYALSDIISELYNKRYLESDIDECYKVSPRGIEFLQNKRNVMGNNPSNHITNNINAPIGNFQQLTSHSTQSFSQIHAPNSIPDDLAGQIALLREELKKFSKEQENAGHDTSDYDEAIGLVTSAKKALEKGDDSGAKTYLLSGGKWVAEFASKLGVNLVTELIKQQTTL